MYKHSVLFKIPNPFHRDGDFFSNLISVHLTSGGWEPLINLPKFRGNDASKHWILKIHLGRGAGYKLGRTIYLARNIRREKKYNNAVNKPGWQFGFTNNSNHVPYSNAQ